MKPDHPLAGWFSAQSGIAVLDQFRQSPLSQEKYPEPDWRFLLKAWLALLVGVNVLAFIMGMLSAS